MLPLAHYLQYNPKPPIVRILMCLHNQVTDCLMHLVYILAFHLYGLRLSPRYNLQRKPVSSLPVLGVKLGEDGYSSDLNNVLSNPYKIQTTAFAYNTANKPPVSGSSDMQSGVAIYIPAFVYSYIMGIQIASKFDGSDIFIRVLWTGSFSVWKQISLT